MMKLKPAKVTIGQVIVRVAEIKRLQADEDKVEADREIEQLHVDVLFTIASAPTMADKRELKRLAMAALEIHVQEEQ